MKKRYLITIAFSIFICYSCDFSKLLTINGQRPYILTTECGEINLLMTKFGKGYFLSQTFFGNNFILNPDSLHIRLVSENRFLSNVGIRKSEQNAPFIEEKTEVSYGETFNLIFTFELKENKTDITNPGKEVLYIYPNSYIMCNNSSVITDTLIIDLSDITINGIFRKNKGF